MQTALDDALDKYWEHPAYWSAWRMAFEQSSARRQLLTKLLPRIPPSWGKLDFFEDHGGGSLLLLFTHNIDNDGARKNELRILSTLAATGAVRHFGAEGTSGEIDLHRYRDFPNQSAIQITAEYLFRERKISPLVAVMFCSPIAVETWGIEDPVLYAKAKEQLLTRSSEYWTTIATRIPVLYENLMAKMREWEIDVAGATITDHNYWEGHVVLSKQNISHAGISAALDGTTDFGRTIRDMEAPPTPLERLFNTEEEDAKKRLEYEEWRKRQRR